MNSDPSSLPSTDTLSTRVPILNSFIQNRRLFYLTVLSLAIILIVTAVLARFFGAAIPTASSYQPSYQSQTAATPYTLSSSTSQQNNGSLKGTAVPETLPYPTAIVPNYPDPRLISPQTKEALDRLGNPDKFIVISLAGQYLQAYEKGKLVRWTYVTTGRPGMETPTGQFQIMRKLSPYTFNPLSTDPSSAYFSYASKVQYAMAFAPGGYYIHDVWWRTVYGPGTNFYHLDQGRREWSPGSHGCVNTPMEVVAWLYLWASVGTPVYVFH
jgi:lipoprotein-anchoring transpeptidase ErfK/SrfK